ncbi:tRNA lysidine(34) synthetase TilS [Shimia abyssi]|uniref:tRNA(Ile)-lysidine synthase n=1 Tax=Shimia abyssi TaxID=1662395 RepID=A0A2P8FE22_9RHOB|nr:tRNA lysidine(34) synthetase TilS [Shimia abyssi]PSL19966.1 tRNA(Ile)-lysidine synthase [Shimia abyssi]
MDRLAETLAGFFVGDAPRIGVAVSGGGDSMAMLDLLRRAGVALDVVSVDHGFRAEAADEMTLVARYCARHVLRHDVLSWSWDGRGNKQDAAREGRAALIADWAVARGLGHVALGHTLDDQAETVLMRLSRGSGVDGLAAMMPVSQRLGVRWLRPVLSVQRAELRAYLRAEEQAWADDPSNDDTSYDRVRVRKLLEGLEPMGLSAKRLARTAAHMARARDALDWALGALVREVVTLDSGDVVITLPKFAAAPEDLQTRLLARALGWISGDAYKPRYSALEAALKSKTVFALSGCLVIRKRDQLRITREWAAVAESCCAVGELWDGRWRLTGDAQNGMEIRALGEAGLAECTEWRATGRPRQSLLASPSVWHNGVLVAAPLAGLDAGWYAEIVPEHGDFVGLC